MPGDSRPAPPAIWRWLLNVAGAIVPSSGRAAWRVRREGSLQSIWILSERGELAGTRSATLAWFCRDTFSDALLLRGGGFDPRRCVRTPAFLLCAAAFAFLAMAAATHGFSATRWLLHAFAPNAGGALHDRLLIHLVAGTFASLTAMMTAIGRIPLRGHSWRYHAFLFVKTLAAAAIVFLLWIEGGAALRACMTSVPLRIIVGGLLFTAAFIVALDWAVIWSLADQQHRCPVCLRRLVLPVRIGTWASVFEPVTTEWVCEEGHGALCMREVESGAPDFWIAGEPQVAVKHS